MTETFRAYVGACRHKGAGISSLSMHATVPTFAATLASLPATQILPLASQHLPGGAQTHLGFLHTLDGFHVFFRTGAKHL